VRVIGFDARVEDKGPPKAELVFGLVDIGAQVRKVALVNGKDPILVHVVDVQVLHVEGHVVVQISLDHPLHMAQVFVTIATELKAKRPEWRHDRTTNHRSVQLTDMLGIVSDKNKEVEYAPSGLPRHRWMRHQGV